MKRPRTPGYVHRIVASGMVRIMGPQFVRARSRKTVMRWIPPVERVKTTGTGPDPTCYRPQVAFMADLASIRRFHGRLTNVVRSTFTPMVAGRMLPG